VDEFWNCHLYPAFKAKQVCTFDGCLRGVNVLQKLVLKHFNNVISNCCEHFVEVFENKFLNDGHTIV
jgi:hypothetical protein